MSKSKIVEYAIEAIKSIPKVIKQTKDFFSKKKGKTSEKKSKEKQVDINDRKQNNKAKTKKKEDKPEVEETTKHRDALDTEREKAANQNTSKATGRSPGGLDKIENAPSSPVGKQGHNIEKKAQKVKEDAKIEGDIKKSKEMSESSHQERIGDKKIEQILEEGPSEKDKNWQERVRPGDKSEFKPLHESEINEKVVNLLKEDSTAPLMPDKENKQTLPLNDGDKSKVVSMMTDKKGILPEEITKSPSKIDTYDLVTKNTAAIDAKEDANFLEEVQFDMAAINPSIDSDLEMEGEGDIEFDFD